MKLKITQENNKYQIRFDKKTPKLDLSNPNFIVINNNSGTLSSVTVSSNVLMTSNTKYFVDSLSLVVLTLPFNPTDTDLLEVRGISESWQIAISNHPVRISNTTANTYLESDTRDNFVKLEFKSGFWLVENFCGYLNVI